VHSGQSAKSLFIFFSRAVQWNISCIRHLFVFFRKKQADRVQGEFRHMVMFFSKNAYPEFSRAMTHPGFERLMMMIQRNTSGEQNIFNNCRPRISTSPRVGEVDLAKKHLEGREVGRG
jgi:hypothetical protein